MMENEDKTKFYATLIGIMVAVAVLVLLVDMTIKAAILQESNAFKKQMNEVKHGRGSDQANSNGVDNHAPNDGAISGDVLGFFPPRMATQSLRTGAARETGPGPMAGTIEFSERNGNGGVAPDDIEVDT
jgi:hypothetical protein